MAFTLSLIGVNAWELGGYLMGVPASALTVKIQ